MPPKRKTLPAADVQPSTSTPISPEQTLESLNYLTENVRQVTHIMADLAQSVSTISSATAANASATQSIPTSSQNINLVQPISPYDPLNELDSMERYIEKIEQLADVNKWDEKTIIYMATTNLRGLAHTWYHSRSRANYSWEELKELLMESFHDDVNYPNVMRKILNRTTKPDEDLLVYYHEKLALIDVLNFTDKVAVSLLIDGLTNSEIKASARAGRHKTPASLLQYLKTFRSEAGPSREPPKKAPPKRGRVFRPYPRRSVKCFHCNEMGHIAPNCPKKRGKSYKNVMTTKSNQVSSKDKYFMSVLLNGESVRAFIDFGSSVMTMNETTAKKLNVDMYEHNEYLKGFGGGVVQSTKKTVPIRIEVDECQTELNFLIVPDEVQNVPIIVGQPFTEANGIIVIKTEDKLRFLKERKTLKCILRVDSDTIIPSNYVGYVTCIANVEGEVFVEGGLRMKEGEETEVPSCILHIEKNGKCRVPVTNMSRGEVLVKADNVLARGFTCYPEDVNDNNAQTPDTRNLTKLTENDLNIDEHISPEQREQLLQLINENRSCFAMTLEELGCAKNAKMSIKLLSEKPIFYRPYRMAHTEREEVKKMIAKLQDAGIIRDSDSPYASPILLVKKPNGEKRLCIDFRKLNAITEKDRHPLPLIDDQIDQLRGYKYFTTLDLYSGYYQVEMEENSKEKTAFVTCYGQYEFNRMPFGLTNAPSVFQRLINRVLGTLRGTSAMAYLDDILCPGRTFEEGLKNLKDVFKVLEENKLTLNPKKCFFFKNVINYLGFEINEEGVRPGFDKIKAVKEFPVPKNIHNIRQFLGLTGFFRRFVEKYAEIARPLSLLLHKGHFWKWEGEQEKAFKTLKEKLSKRPILAIYDSKLETEVHTDASKHGIAGILMQKVDGQFKPIGYFSRQLTVTESRWHSYELETLAVVETLRRYRVYLLGLQFVVVTDCSAIKNAAEKRDLIPKIARWWLQLQEFSFTVEHRAGRKMSHVDALSRNPVDDNAPRTENFVFKIVTEDWVLAGQMTDKQLEAIHKILEKPPTDDYERKVHKNYKLKDNRLYKRFNDKELWVVPRNMRRDILRSCHDEFGHFSTEKTLNKLLECYWFPKMRQYVEKYIASCVKCLYHKVPKGKQEGMMHLINKPTVPFQTVHIDHMGPFNKSKSGKKYIFVLVDAFTKYVQMTATKDTATAPVIKYMTELMNTYGVPTNIISDRGTCFTSKAFKTFCEKTGSKHILNAVATPRANGQVERYNGTILACLSTSIKDEKEWDKKLPQIQFSLNNTTNDTTRKTPCELLMGYKPRSSADSILTCEIQKERPKVADIEKERQSASKRTRDVQEKSKK